VFGTSRFVVKIEIIFLLKTLNQYRFLSLEES